MVEDRVTTIHSYSRFEISEHQLGILETLIEVHFIGTCLSVKGDNRPEAIFLWHNSELPLWILQLFRVLRIERTHLSKIVLAEHGNSKMSDESPYRLAIVKQFIALFMIVRNVEVVLH
jgi:hypothetical protein